MRRIFSFLLGTASGALVGATLAILLTPHSGADLRTELQDRLKRFRTEMQDAADQRRAELTRELETMRHPRPEKRQED